MLRLRELKQHTQPLNAGQWSSKDCNPSVPDSTPALPAVQAGKHCVSSKLR